MTSVDAPGTRVDASELYRLPPEQFTAARDGAARQRRADGDRDGALALKALRRPSVAAWLVNLLALHQPELLAQLLDLGPALAHAQAGRDAAALRELGAQRRSLVEAVTATAVDTGGRPVPTAVREEVAATLEAALADPASAQAVRSGRLVRALSYAGFGDVDLSDAVAPQGPATRSPAPTATTSAPSGGEIGPDRPDRRGAAKAARERQERARRLAEAETAALAAAGRLDDAVRACEQAERDREAAQRTAEERAAAVERLTEELARSRAERDAAVAGARAAQAAADKALGKVRRAQDAAETARSALDGLRRDA